MSYVLTFVASASNPDVTPKHIKACEEVFDFYNLQKTSAPVWLEKGRAVDLGINDKPQTAMIAHMKSLLYSDKIDLFITSVDKRRKKIMLADMDSTIVSTETLDELAEHVGLKEKIAAITQMSMEGKLDFQASLRERVALLKGMEQEKLQQTLDQTHFNNGAEIFVRTMRKHGAITVLVTGGFTFFSGGIAQRAGFEFHHANELLTDRGVLTGKVKEPILDKYAKLDFMRQYVNKNKLKDNDCLAIGDGANDLPMLKAAGLGIGYRPKKVVAEEISNCILYGDLTAALYAQGFTGKHFVAV